MPKLRSSRVAPSIARAAFALALLSVIPVTGLRAQTAEQRRLDSLALRLEDAEAALEALRQGLATEAESGVRTRSRVAVELSGRVLMNVFANSKVTNNADVPMYRKQVPAGTPKGGLGFGIRQTSLAAALTAQDVLGGTFTGDLDVDFFGGQVPSPGGRTFPLMRIRTARAIIEWEHSQLLIGQEQPLVAGLNPLSLASIGAPNFSYAGNLWLWLPQIRYSMERGSRVRFKSQYAILAPTAGQPVEFFATGFDAAERSKMPFLQNRSAIAWGDEENPIEIGLGLHLGQVNNQLENGEVSEAITLDFMVPIGERFEFRGEAFKGAALAGLGGGGLGQNFGLDSLRALESTGGWVQFNYKHSPRLLMGAGYGFDDPNDDRTPTLLHNATSEVHLHWRPSGPLVMGVEWRSTRTRYALSDYPNTHINLAFGFEF
jgi:hypothetical protein